MSKEAMQAAAIYAATGALPGGSALGCLTWMAYFSRDTQAPFHTNVSPKTLEKLLNLEARRVRKIIEALKGAKLLDTEERDEQDRRRRLFTLHLPDPDQIAYSQLFAPPEYRHPSAYMDEDIGIPVPTDIGIPVPTPQEYRHSSAGDVGTHEGRYRHSSAVSTYKGEMEKREEKGEALSQQLEKLQAQIAEAEAAPPPLPPSPEASTRSNTVWIRVREDIKRKGISNESARNRLIGARLELLEIEQQAVVIVPSSPDWFRSEFGHAIKEALYHVTQIHWDVSIGSARELREWRQDASTI